MRDRHEPAVAIIPDYYLFSATASMTL